MQNRTRRRTGPGPPRPGSRLVACRLGFQVRGVDHHPGGGYVRDWVRPVVRVSAGCLDAVRRARAELAALVAAAADRAAAHCAVPDGAPVPYSALLSVPSGHRVAHGEPAAKIARARSVAVVSSVLAWITDPSYRTSVRYTSGR